MKKGWTTASLGDLCRLEKGLSPTMKTEPGEYPLVVTAAFRRTSSEHQFSEPAVCIPIVSSTGHGNAAIHRIHYEEGKFALANLLVAAIPKDSSILDAKYLWRFLSAVKDKVLVPLMQGTSNVTLKPNELLGVNVVFPALEEQQRIVSNLDAIEVRLSQVRKLREEQQIELESILRSTFHRIEAESDWYKLGDVAPQARRELFIDPDETYTEYGIKSFYRGIFLRRKMKGDEYTWQKLFKLKKGDVVFSNIMAWEKAIGLAGTEQDGWVGNHRMLVCEPQREKVVPEWLYYYFTTSRGFDEISKASPGTAARNKTLKPSNLSAIPVPVPTLEMQNEFKKLMDFEVAFQKEAQQSTIRSSAVVPAFLSHAFKDCYSGG